MGITEPIRRIKFAEKEVKRYRDDVEGWKKLHDDLQEDCWIWEDLIAKANFIFLRYLKLDHDIQQAILTSVIDYSEETEQEMWTLLRDWLDISRQLIPQVDRLKQSYGSVDGSEDLLRNVKEAEAMLTPDDEFFSGDKLVSLRDRAIEDHRSGETRTLLDDESQS